MPTQTIVIGGIKNKYESGNCTFPLHEAVDCLNQEQQASMNFVGEAEAAEKVTITRAYDRDADTLTHTRVWTDAGWTEYQAHSDNTNAVKAAMETAGYTVTITES